MCVVFFFKQKTAYEMRISDWSSDVCSSDLRLILQWLAETEAYYGKDEPERGVGSGLSTVEAGLRLSYEIRRELAPYIGVTWERAYGGTADYRRAQFDDIEDTRFVRSEEHTSELKSLMRISYAGLWLKTT